MMIKKLLSCLIICLLFSTTILAATFDTEQYTITYSDQHFVKQDNYLYDKETLETDFVNNIYITVEESTSTLPLSQYYTEESLEQLCDEFERSFKENIEESIKAFKESNTELSDHITEEELTELFHSFKVIDSKITTLNHYDALYFHYTTNILSGTQYLILTDHYLYNITATSNTDEYINQDHVQDLLNSFTIKDTISNNHISNQQKAILIIIFIIIAIILIYNYRNNQKKALLKQQEIQNKTVESNNHSPIEPYTTSNNPFNKK